MLSTFTPYSTARPLMGTLPTWLREADAERIQAYQLYEQMYWNAPDTYSLVHRGSDTDPIYVPAPKKIIEACNRYLAKGWDFVIDPVSGSPADRNAVHALLRSLFVREQMYAKFNSQKRYGLIRGDAVWHIVADPSKPEGSRLSVHEVDPAAYFPIYDQDNPDRIVGVHLVDQHIDETTANTVVIRRQTYRKDPESGTITSELSYWESGKWDDRTWGGNKAPELKLVRIVNPVTPLPPSITAIPVYLIKNVRNPADPFGSSELRGIERLAAAVNQSVTDEELSLALSGLGLYATTAGPPRDENDNEVDWQLGPGRVVEIGPDDTFQRVSGVTTVMPYQDHINLLDKFMSQSAGVSDAAMGIVDVSVAASGIALRLHMEPLLASNAEKEVEMLSVYDHMIYDIVNMWFPAYESLNPNGVIAGFVVGDPLPVDRTAKIDELIKLVTAQLISADSARIELMRLGYDIPGSEQNTILEEQAAMAMALGSDPFLDRMRSEGTLNGTPPDVPVWTPGAGGSGTPATTTAIAAPVAGGTP